MPSKLLARIRIPGEPSIIVEFPEKDRDQGSQACDCDDHHEKVEEATPALTDRDLVSGHPREEELLNTCFLREFGKSYLRFMGDWF